MFSKLLAFFFQIHYSHLNMLLNLAIFIILGCTSILFHNRPPTAYQPLHYRLLRHLVLIFFTYLLWPLLSGLLTLLGLSLSSLPVLLLLVGPYFALSYLFARFIRFPKPLYQTFIYTLTWLALFYLIFQSQPL